MESNTIKGTSLSKPVKKRFSTLSRIFKNAVPRKSIIEETIVETVDNNQILIENIKAAKTEWLNASINFQYVSENEFVEYYTYTLKAAQIKYEFFLREAKKKGLKVNSDTCILNGNND